VEGTTKVAVASAIILRSLGFKVYASIVDGSIRLPLKPTLATVGSWPSAELPACVNCFGYVVKNVTRTQDLA
jgi:hypothetical protein